MGSTQSFSGFLWQIAKLILIGTVVVVGFALTTVVGFFVLAFLLIYRFLRQARQPARPVHGPQVFEGEFAVVHRPDAAVPESLEWPKPFDSTRPQR